MTPASAHRYGRTSAGYRKGHLYLVLNDWKKGFSIHKLDLHDGSDGGDLALRPPVHRQSSEQTNYWSFAAVGSNIIATENLSSPGIGCVTLAYDTETAGLSIIPDLPKPLHGHWIHAAAAGNQLYTFVGNLDDQEGCSEGCMHHLEDVPPPTDREAYWCGNRDHWSWSSIPSTLPFNVYQMLSIAVHPEGGGRTLFVSVEGGGASDPWSEGAGNGALGHFGEGIPSRTYSNDIESGKWTGHCEWGLPFFGQVHYNKELDAWVGLHKAHGDPDGYISSCDPAWNLCMERLFDPHAEAMRLYRDRHVPASLVYMGDSTYCLVEVVPQERFKRRRCTSTGSKCMIRLSMFQLKYSKNGKLRTTVQRPNRSYHFPKYNENFQVQAFWM
ncbi:hypothetical protein VPH35_004679 [Triticum aestivum]